MGCDIISPTNRGLSWISIHAPTWGATSDHDSDGSDDSISIHAPTWGATPSDAFKERQEDISIHAPTWGATAGTPSGGRNTAHFNPRTHVGCDFPTRAVLTSHTNFNPRTHVGCDAERMGFVVPKSISIHAPTWGATRDGARLRGIMSISIHAPTWGATWIISVVQRQICKFQSTHPRGVRLCFESWDDYNV